MIGPCNLDIMTKASSNCPILSHHIVILNNIFFKSVLLAWTFKRRYLHL